MAATATRDLGRYALEQIFGNTLKHDTGACIEYAFAYGSVAVPQLRHETKSSTSMLDIIVATSCDPYEFHKRNMLRNPGHYPVFIRSLGPSFASQVQSFGAGVYFVPGVSVPGLPVRVKYGVASTKSLLDDLLNWRFLYLAGRMHKPIIRLTAPNLTVEAAQAKNLFCAAHLAMLVSDETQSSKVDMHNLLEDIVALSYTGDVRMKVGFEARKKVTNIVKAQESALAEMYKDAIPKAIEATNRVRQAPSKKFMSLPRPFVCRVLNSLPNDPLTGEASDNVKTLATLKKALKNALQKTVSSAAYAQSAKGFLTAGPTESLKYLMAKLKRAREDHAKKI